MRRLAHCIHIAPYVYALLTYALFTGLAGVGLAEADDCGKLNKEVTRLKAEYRDAASMAAQADPDTGFDHLTAILDKIVDAKRRMRNLGCGERKRSPKRNF